MRENKWTKNLNAIIAIVRSLEAAQSGRVVYWLSDWQ